LTQVVYAHYEIAAVYGLSWREFLEFTPRTFSIFCQNREKYLKAMQEADNTRAGQICATIANIFTKRSFKATDFFNFEKKIIPKKQSAEELALILRRWTLALGGEINE
jgi:hypothetical protein